jgi:transposase
MFGFVKLLQGRADTLHCTTIRFALHKQVAGDIDADLADRARARQAAAALANNTSTNSSNNSGTSGSIEDVGQKHVENFEFSSSDGSDAPFDTYDNPEV